MERKPRKKYSREFKLEAVRLAAVDERPKAQVARQLGIRVNLLRNWRLEFEREERKPAARVETLMQVRKYIGGSHNMAAYRPFLRLGSSRTDFPVLLIAGGFGKEVVGKKVVPETPRGGS